MTKRIESRQVHVCRNQAAVRLNQFLQLGRGSGRSVLIIGESPAARGWRLSGKAFYTPEGRLLPSGRHLNQCLGIVGLCVERCGFTELIKCYIDGDRSQLQSCGSKCWPILLRQLGRYKFRIMIILGARTLKIINHMLGAALGIGEFGTVTIGRTRYRMLAVYHPSPRNPASHRRNIDIFKSVAPEFRRILKYFSPRAS